MRKFSVEEVANEYMEQYGQVADKNAKAMQYVEAEVFARKFGYILLRLKEKQRGE